MKDRRTWTSGLAVKIYIAIAGLSLLVLLLDIFILPWIVHSSSEIAVPDVVGKGTVEAQQLLSARGLTPIVSADAPSDKIPPGHVLYQDPVGQSIVREGRNVYLTISGGEEKIQMPNLRGRSFRDAKITLEQLDLKLGLVTYQPSELPVETVIAQALQPGTMVSRNAPIEITLSSGPEMIMLDVPYLIGMSLSEAQRTLVAQGLRLGSVTYRQSSNLLPNTVIAQTPGAGEKAEINSPVAVTIVH